MEDPIYIKPTAATRNAACTCGSGKKLKKCCGSLTRFNEYTAWYDEQQRLARQRRYEEHQREQAEYMTQARELAAPGLPPARRRMGYGQMIGLLAGFTALSASHPLGAEIISRNPK